MLRFTRNDLAQPLALVSRSNECGRVVHLQRTRSKLIYITNTSLDGSVEDETGAIDWVNPDQVVAFITVLLGRLEPIFYGRRLFETMAYWNAPVEGSPPEHLDFVRVWQQPEKIVFSRTLTGLAEARAKREGWLGVRDDFRNWLIRAAR